MIASWYVPAGAEMPAHVPRISPQQIAPGCGPDRGQGLAWGAPYDPAAAWRPCSDGAWWIDVGSLSAATTARTDAAPGLLVPGGWHVPRILRPDGRSAVGYWGPQGWTVPDAWRDLVERMMASTRYVGQVQEHHAALAADLLGRSHHVTIHELGHLGMLTDDMVVAVVMAAMGLTPETLAEADRILSQEHA